MMSRSATRSFCATPDRAQANNRIQSKGENQPMQCSICKKNDELANLKTTVDAAGRNSYAHRRCIDEHNKIATKKLRAVDAAMIATMISDYDLDATDPYVVAEFLRRKKPAPSLTGRLPTADEIGQKNRCSSGLKRRSSEQKLRSARPLSRRSPRISKNSCARMKTPVISRHGC
jgi:hypothetical protein